MHCPKCQTKSRVIDSRTSRDLKTVRRRHECLNPGCLHKISTVEREQFFAGRVWKKEHTMERHLKLILKIAQRGIKQPKKKGKKHDERSE